MKTKQPDPINHLTRFFFVILAAFALWQIASHDFSSYDPAPMNKIIQNLHNQNVAEEEKIRRQIFQKNLKSTPSPLPFDQESIYHEI